MTTIEPSQSRFRLPHWGCFALTTVVLIVAALALSVWLPYHQEQQIVEYIKGQCREIERQKGGPDWLRRVVGDERMEVFSRVIGVVSTPDEFTDVELAKVRELTNLKSLVLWGTSVTEAGLAHFDELPNLEILDLHDVPLNDAGVFHFDGLTSLQTLTLSKTSVSDAGFATLQKALPKCVIRRW